MQPTSATSIRRLRPGSTPIPGGLFEGSGSAGKLILFAVRLDTFPAEERTATFYVGTNRPAELTEIRRRMLTGCDTLPVAAEYLHRDAFDTAAAYGKDMFLASSVSAPTGCRRFLRSRRGWTPLPAPGVSGQPDRTGCCSRIARLLPPHLPARLHAFRDAYEHHLMLPWAGAACEARGYLATRFPSATGDFFECTPAEGKAAFLHRFVVAGAAVRYRAVHPREVEDIVALDVALRRNDRDWLERLRRRSTRRSSSKLYYGHFFCHVFHQDYVVEGARLPRRWSTRCGSSSTRAARNTRPSTMSATSTTPSRRWPASTAGSIPQQLNPGIGRTPKCAHWTENFDDAEKTDAR